MRVYNDATEAYEEVTLSEDVDDLIVFVTATPYAGGTKATGGPSYSVSGGKLVIHHGRLWVNASKDWFFDQTPETSSDLPVGAQYDFLSTALHETGHVLGFLMDAYDALGLRDVSRGVFLGREATRVLGRAPELEEDSSHVTLATTQKLPRPYLDENLMNASEVISGFRYYPRALDLAMLRDLGYTINTAQMPLVFDERLAPDPRRLPYLPATPGASRVADAPNVLLYTDTCDHQGVLLGFPLKHHPRLVPASGTAGPTAAPELWFEGFRRSDRGAYEILTHSIPSNGGGECVNVYSLVLDVRLPELQKPFALLNTSPTNQNSAELFVSATGHLTASTGATSAASAAPPITPNQWTRVAAVVDLPHKSLTLYIDGSEVLSAPISGVDGQWSLSTFACWGGNVLALFGDADAEADSPLDFRAIALYPRALSPAEVAALGDPSKPLAE